MDDPGITAFTVNGKEKSFLVTNISAYGHELRLPIFSVFFASKGIPNKSSISCLSIIFLSLFQFTSSMKVVVSKWIFSPCHFPVETNLQLFHKSFQSVLQFRTIAS